MEDQKKIMFKKGLIILLLYSGLMAIDNADAAVKVYLDESRTKYVMAEELDCKIYEGETGMTIGFKASVLFFNIGPEFKFGGYKKTEWDRAVQGIIARYKELCARFNSGAMTMKEYKERLEQIDGISKEALELQEKMIKNVKKDSRDAFGELETETKDKKEITPYDISNRLDKINSQLMNLK